MTGDTPAEQANSAREKLRAHGYAAAQDWGIASHDTLGLWRSLQATYANAYGRFAVEDNVCGMSFAATDPAPAGRRRSPRRGEAPVRRQLGRAGHRRVNVVADRAANGPILEGRRFRAPPTAPTSTSTARCASGRCRPAKASLARRISSTSRA